MLQVGVTAMLIASKYEEIWAPELHDFVYISDRAYKKDQILGMEKVMLNSLKFNLTGAPQSPPLSRCRQNPGMLRMFVLIWMSVCPGTPEHRYQVTALFCRSPTNARAAHVSRSFYFGKRISVFAQILFSLKLICAASRSADALQFSGALPQGGGRLPGQGGAAVRQLPHGACPARLRHAEVLLLSDSRGSRVCSQQARQSPFC